MGLNAVVYIHRNNLALDQESDALKTDEETGEVYLKDAEITKQHPKATFVAVDKRLGNIDAIAAVRSEISKIIGDKSILYSKVLYSGAHSGDIIGLECLDKLESEINLTEEAIGNSRLPALKSFLGAMKELVEAAKEQKNPIVFI